MSFLYHVRNPGRFAHFPVRPCVVSPDFPFAPSRFAPGSFRPLSRSPLSRFAHFPVRLWIVSPPYKILFLVLLFRSQKWDKALIFLLIDDFSYYKRWKTTTTTTTTTAFYAVFRNVTKQFVCQPQSWFILSILRSYIAWAFVTPKKRILYCSNF